MNSDISLKIPSNLPRRNRFTTPIILITLFMMVLVLSNSLIFAANSVSIVKMEPSGEVEPKTNFIFTFSTDIVPKSRIGKVMSNNRIRFRPEVPGKIRWETPRRLKFLPEVSLQPSTAYTVEFKANFLEELKKTLTGNRKFQFTTERLKVENSNLSFVYNPERKRGIIFQARISFNYPVQIDTLQRSLGLVFIDKRQPIKYNVSLANGGRDALITSELIHRTATPRKIELKIAQGFLCAGATIGLKDNYVKTADFQERRALYINEINAASEEGFNTINIRCSEPVDPDAVENFIVLKPKAKFRISAGSETITLTGEALKSGQTYNVKILKGLPSLNGNPLEKDYNDDITFPDLEPSVNFNAPGRYLSNKGNVNLGLETVNISKVEVEIAKIYANNIVGFFGSLGEDGYCYDLERYGRTISRKTLAVSGEENTVITNPIALGEFLSDKRKGIFQIKACDPENRWRNAAKIAIVTDLGILAKMTRDELVVWINSLDTLAPKPGTKVSLVSYNNQVIAAGETNAQGMVILDGLKSQLQDFRSYMIIAELADDLSFVCLNDSLIDKTDFPVDGHAPLTEGFEAFLYTDRGVYRPGEQANLMAIVRGPNNSVPPEFPVRLEILGPDGRVFRELASSTKSSGLCQFPVAFPDYARTGKYTAVLKAAEQEIGMTAFSVEEFMPDRIKVETILDKDLYTVGESAKVKIRGMNLFGPPAAGRKADLSIRMEAVPFSPPDFRSYRFGDPDREFKMIDQPIGQGELDKNGLAEFSYDFPNNLYPSGFIRTIFQATVTEEGGRAVSSYKAVEYHPYDSYIGMKTTGDYYAKVGEAYPIHLVLVNPKGRLIPGANLEAEIYSVTWNSIYRRDRRGNYTYHCERQETKLAKETVKMDAGEGQFTYRAPEYGCFKIVFTDPRNGSRSTYEFYATGWGYAPWAMDHPDRIQLDLDKTLYKPGMTASVQIKAPFSGRALVTVEREKVYDYKVVELKDNTAMVEIPVKPEYKPNVYISVHLIRTTKQLDKRAPTRAYGTIPLMVDNGDNRINLTIESAPEVRPNREVEVQISAPGQTGDAFLTLAAVDEGICQLTEFTTPDPFAFFYGKRSLILNTYDLYGMLLPEVESVNTTGAPGGDEDMEGVRRRNLNPVSVRRVKPVSLWSGLAKFDSSGKATVKLSVPQFNGTLRLMAVAVSGANYGSATNKMLVRDPAVITSTFPRFLAPGDRAVIPVSLFNGTGKEGVFNVKLDVSGPVTVDGYDTKNLTVPNQQERTVHFAVIAKEAVGKCSFRLTAKGNDTSVSEVTELAIRADRQVTSQIFAGSLDAKKPVELNLQNTWLPGTGEYTLSLAPLPAMKFSGGLKYLLVYPYGCIEQTTSKLFPLLYFDELARVVEPDRFSGDRSKKYLVEGIEKIQSMQLRDGSFSFWPGSDWSYDWGSVYAAHFLVEARKSGHIVSDRVYNRMLDYLWQLGKHRSDESWTLQLRIYALYVLSLAGKPQLGSLAYIKNQRIKDLYADTRTMLAAAYYYSGDKKTARELIPTAITFSDFKRQKSGNLNSPVRNESIILSLMADIDPNNPAVPKLINRITGGIELNRWGTTQENAYAFMALGKILKNSVAPDFTGEVLCNGQRIATFDSKSVKRITDSRIGQSKITIKINGKGDCYFYADTSGISPQPIPNADKGISVKREFYDRNGAMIDLKKPLKQGDLLVAKITVKTVEDNTDNVAIVDMLPAGLEIENPRLATSAKMSWLDRNLFTPSYMDIRDDRIILFANFEESGTQTFFYAVRVVSCGTFTVPQVKTECMYAPEVTSISSGGMITIKE
jgi:uncharacterized protein YfaS (alpha-2-macroglobulin family)